MVDDIAVCRGKRALPALPDLRVVAKPVGWPSRAAPFDRAALGVEREALDHDERGAGFTAEQPRLHGARGLHRQRLVGRGDDLAAAGLVERIEQIAEIAGIEVENGSEARALEPDLLR